MAGEFKWNQQPEREPDLHQIAKAKAWGREGKLAHYLVDIRSALEQLQTAHLTQEQRAGLAQLMREAYFGLQGLASQMADPDARELITYYLVVVGSMAACLSESPYTFLQALSRGVLIQWVEVFYNAAHEIEGDRLDPNAIASEREARRSLMHMIENKE